MGLVRRIGQVKYVSVAALESQTRRQFAIQVELVAFAVLVFASLDNNLISDFFLTLHNAALLRF